MSAKQLKITGKYRENPNALPGLADFDFTSDGEIPLENLLNNPYANLYALDFPSQQAVFVETFTDVNLTKAPFIYQAQFENARRLYTVPLSSLNTLADDLPFDSRRLILIYSVGRSGSTLLNAAFSEVEGVVGLSEPDIYTQLVGVRQWDGSLDPMVRELIRNCTKVICRQVPGQSVPQAWMIKLRSFGIEISDLFMHEFPESKLIFLYRDALTWAESALRAFVAENYEDPVYIRDTINWLRPIAHLVDSELSDADEIPELAAIPAYLWLSVMERWLSICEMGKPTFSLRFKDLIASPNDAIKAVFRFCGLIDVNYERVFEVLNRDSQAGSNLSREKLKQKKITPPKNFHNDFRAVLRTRSVVQTPDFLIPGSWHPPVAGE